MPGMRKAEVAGGGYVNLFLDRARSRARSTTHLVRRRGPSRPRRGRTIVEHTSINPNKAAHIGHLRNSILGDTFVNILRHRGHEVGIQNYIDDTGVQVADVVVGFQHLEKKTLAEVERLDGRFDYYCWDLYARVGDFYAADPANKTLQAETLHAIEAGEGETARLAAHVAARIVDCHLATMARLGIGYDLLAHESDILRLHFWDRAFELLKESGAIRLETEGKSEGCWVLAMGGEADAADAAGAGSEDPAPEARRAVDEDKIIVRSNGTVTYTGKDIAYQLWKFGQARPRLPLSPPPRATRAACSGPPRAATGESGAPVFGHATQVFNVIDVGQSYPQRVVKAGVAALGHADARRAARTTWPTRRSCSPPPPPAPSATTVGEDDAAVKVSGRKGLGVKADDLLDALVAKAKQEIEARDPERAAGRAGPGRPRHRGGRPPLLPAQVLAAHASSPSTWRRPWPSWARPGPTSRTRWCARRNILAKLDARGTPSGRALLERAAACDLASPARGRGGRRGLVAPPAHGPDRRDGRAGRAVAGGGAPGQARLRGRPGLPLLLPEARLLGALRAERGPAGLPHPGGRRLPARRCRCSPASWESRSPSGCDAASGRRHDRQRPTGGQGIFSLRQDYVRAVEAAGGLPLVLAPGGRRTPPTSWSGSTAWS